MEKAANNRFQIECECGLAVTNYEYQGVVQHIQQHRCSAKSILTISCRCGEISELPRRDLWLHEENHFCLYKADTKSSPPLRLFRVGSKESVASVEVLDSTGFPMKWMCFQDECRTKVQKKYKTFMSHKNWEAHMLKEHKSSIKFPDYIERFKPDDVDAEADIISEFGNLSFSK
jgi:hypothetical protein